VDASRGDLPGVPLNPFQVIEHGQEHRRRPRQADAFDQALLVKQGEVVGSSLEPPAFLEDVLDQGVVVRPDGVADALRELDRRAKQLGQLLLRTLGEEDALVDDLADRPDQRLDVVADPLEVSGCGWLVIRAGRPCLPAPRNDSRAFSC
jgi:hypothetical protein